MTYEQIDNLVVKDREYFLAERLLDIVGEKDNWIHPDGNELDGDGNPIKDLSYSVAQLNPDKGVKPSAVDLADELEIYKQELRDIEDARLAEVARIQNLKERWSQLFDSRMAVDNSIANPDAYFRDEILKHEDKDLAEQRLQDCENKSQAFKVQYEAEQEQLPMDVMKKERDEKLWKTDFTQLADAPLSSEEKAEYRQYRQHLRDLPQKVEDQQKLDYSVPTFDEWKAGAV